MANATLSDRDCEALIKYSQKGRTFPIISPLNYRREAQSQKSLGRISSVIEGIVSSRSGYLAVCESTNLNVFSSKTIIDSDVKSVKREGDFYRINFNSPSWLLPKMMQGQDFIVFRNMWGNGLFGVLSSKKNFYVETDVPTFPDNNFLEVVKSGEIIEEKEKGTNRRLSFEGFVGIGSGSAAVTDPEIHKISYVEKSLEISAILKVEPGTYSCRFIEGNKRLSIKREY